MDKLGQTRTSILTKKIKQNKSKSK